MQIFYRNLSGKTATLDVKADELLEVVKIKIYNREGVRPSQFRLVYAGKRLDDDLTLVECGVQRESLLHVVLPFRGGSSTNQPTNPPS